MSNPPSESEELPIAYQAATPYPLIRVSKPNARYATAMLDNAAGQVSEMSSVSLYAYDSMLASGLREASNAFHHIAIVEMRHLDIFTKLAMQLGENPRLWSRQGKSARYTYWSPSYLHYPPISPPQPGSTLSPSGLRLLLKQLIEEEQRTIEKYRKQTAWIDDPDICDNLIRICADEQMHVELLTQLFHHI